MSSDSNRTGIFDKWSKVFENGKPRQLPYRDSSDLENLELEDVFEEVKEEVSSKGQHLTQSMQDEVVVSRLYQPRRRSKDIARPKTPGRSILPHDQESQAKVKRPAWKSSTKVPYQKKVEYVTMQTIENNTIIKEDPPISKPRLPSRAKRITEAKSPIQSKSPSLNSINSSHDVLDDKPLINKPLTPEQHLISPTPSISVMKHVVGGTPISQETAKNLHEVLFGSALASFNYDWRTQHINFLRHSFYGISFYKPGPCGVIACIQAYLMKYLLYCQQTSIVTESVLEPLPSERQQALVSGMANILWQAGSEAQFAIVALPCGDSPEWSSREDYRKDDVTENLVLFGFDNCKELEKFIKRHLSFFENTSGNGCIVFLYSVILSRTIKGVKTDLGNPHSTLIEVNNTCSQAMINLLLTGRAVSHTFNGNVEYNKMGKALPFPLKGVKARSDVGFLTLNEYLKPKEYQVGSMLKTPKYPVWVVDSTGGRFGVIFCLNSELVNDWRLERRFNLYYYNGTTKYSSSLDEMITVDTRDVVDESELTMDNHPVEHCLRTKWPGAVIEWN